MKSIVKILFFCALALIAAGLIAPSFIDWNEHKGEIVARLSPYLKRKLEVSGPASFSLLPQPRLSLGDVKVTDEGGKTLLALKSIDTRVNVNALLQGRVETEEITLSGPDLDLTHGMPDIFSDAQKNLILNKVTVTGGVLRYGDKVFDQAELSIDAGTLQGPYKVSGSVSYQGVRIPLVLETGAFAPSAPVTLSLSPEKDFPALKIGGDLSLKDGFDFAGEASVSGAQISLKDFGLPYTLTEASATVSVKKGLAEFGDIKAGLAEKGALKGKVSVKFAEMEKPFVTADLDGSGIALPSGADMLPFRGSLHFKGRKLRWRDMPVESAEISTAFDGSKWDVKSAKLEGLPGGAKLSLAGSVTPGTELSSFPSAAFEAEDAAVFVQALKLPQTNIVALLPFHKARAAGSLDITPGKISFYNLTATIGDKAGATGVINIDLSDANPNADIKLHLQDWNADDLPAGLLASRMTMELTAGNLLWNDLAISDLSFKGESGAEGVKIDSLTGKTANKDSFSFQGHKGDILEGSFALRVAKPFGVKLPETLSVRNIEAEGTLKGGSWTAKGKAGTLTWRGIDVTDAVFKAESAAPGALKVDIDGGDVWGGKLVQTSLDGEAVKGSIKQAQLQKLFDLVGFSAFKAGNGDLTFDLAGNDGAILLQSSGVTVGGFKTDKLPDEIAKAIGDGPVVFKNLRTGFKLAAGKTDNTELALENEDKKLTLTGTFDALSGSTALAGTLRLPKHEDFPPIPVTFDGKDYVAGSDKGVEDYVARHAAPAPPPVAAPPVQEPPQQQQPIGDILKRLDDEDSAPIPLSPH